MEFKSKGEIFRIQNDPISMKAWIKERDGYTRIQNHSKYFLDKKYIFIVEVQNLDISLANEQNNPVVVSIN